MPTVVRYRRDRVTWTGFSLIGVWAFFLYFMGPASTAISDELGLGGAASGLVGTALAVGMMLSASLSPKGVARWGRAPSLLRALVALSCLALLLAASAKYPMILLAVGGIGLAGATLANVSTAVLADHHATQAPRAITEANAAASWLAIIAPSLLGAFLALPSGWRGAAVLVAVLPLLLLRPAWKLGGPGARGGSGRATSSGGEPLPRQFWFALITVAMAVAVEFSVNFWAAPLIGERTGADLAASATALSAMAFGMALGRTFAAGLASRFPLPRLIIVFFAVAATGLAALMLADTYWLCVAALLLTGLGVSVLFPFAQSNAIAIASSGVDRAVARTAFAAGAALGGAPFLLGLLATKVGLAGAFSMGFLLVALGIASVAATSGPRTRKH